MTDLEQRLAEQMKSDAAVWGKTRADHERKLADDDPGDSDAKRQASRRKHEAARGPRQRSRSKLGKDLVPREPWSPERRAKMAAVVEARQEAKRQKGFEAGQRRMGIRNSGYVNA